MIFVLIGSVSAADVDTNDTEIVSAIDDGEIASVENDLDVLSINASTYSELAGEIGSGGNVQLQHDYYTYDCGDTIEITINDSVIDGNGAIIDMAGSTIQAFSVSASDVTIKNLTIKNAKYYGCGGAIYMFSGSVENCNFVDIKGGAISFVDNGNVTNCNFVDNSASECGGAIWFERTGTVTNCNFTDNKAGYGGAIRMVSGTVENSYFVNNSASEFGGAIFFSNNGNITNCNFTDNCAARNGGAIYFDLTSTGTVTICNFVNNSASGSGGAINLYYDSTGTVENCKFVNNSASECGGAIRFDGKGNITNCNFVNNSVSNDGGAVYFNLNGDVISCNFTNNFASDGGAIMFVRTGMVSNCNFANNRASYFGCAIRANSYDYYVRVNISNCNFINNFAQYQGVIDFGYQSSGSIENCYFFNNSASYRDGAAISFYGKSNVTNCYFVNNSARNGGAIGFYGDGNVTNCYFVNNSARNGGAILFKGTGTVTNCNFTGNNADSGSAIYFEGSSGNRLISNSLFLDNMASVDDICPLQIFKNENSIDIIFIGRNNLLNAIYSDSDINFTNVTYWGANGITNTDNSSTAPYRSQNEAGQNIKVIVFVNDAIVLNTTEVTNDEGKIVLDVSIDGSYTVTARHDADSYYTHAETTKTVIHPSNTYSQLSAEIGSGGNIELKHEYYRYDCGDTIVITVDDSVIDGNGAVIDMTGSNIRAFEVNNSGITIKNLTITGANFDGDGGAIYLGSGNFINCNFVNNFASGSGGAIYLGSGNFINCNFVNNKASYAGAIYFNREGNVTNCNFTSNSARSCGAIRFADNGNVTNCNFVNNSAAMYCGATYMYSGTVENCNFVNNFARGDDVGALSMALGNVTNCNFANNSAYLDGGAIHFNLEGNVTNCNFANNSARSCGGAIDFYRGNVMNCNFTYNSASNGGAIDFDLEGNVTNCNFVNNSASVSGGAIYLDYDSTGTVENCNFTGNNAVRGSAIRFCSYSASNNTVSNSLFLNNRANADAKHPLQIFRKDDGINIVFIGRNNLLNAIYSDCDVNFANVTYWGANGITNTGSSSATPHRSQNEAGQNITVIVVVNDETVLNTTKVTDDDGKIVLDVPIDGSYTVTVSHDADSYYTQAEKTFTNSINGTFSELSDEIAYGGNIVLQHDYYTFDCGDTIEITVDDSVIDGNGAVIDMAGSTIQAFSVSASGVTIKNLTIINTNYEYDGGAIRFSKSGTVENCNFVNDVGRTGGAIKFDDEGTVTNCNFANNSAHGDYACGGAIYFSGSGTVVNCNFTNNNAEVCGGAIWISSGIVSNCNFSNNKARLSDDAFWVYSYDGIPPICGGAVCIGSADIADCNFVNNTASDYGGAIDMGSGTVHNCNFVNNTAYYRGGAICMGSGTVDGCNFTSNNATYGPAIFFYLRYGTGYIANSFFQNNWNAATLQINQNGSKVIITFIGQGGFYYFGANVKLSNVTYWGANGITNMDSSSIASFDYMEVGQNVSVIVVANDILILNATRVLDENCQIVLDAVAGNCTITAHRDADLYYGQVEATETFNNPGNETTLKLSASGRTVEATITPGIADGNVTFTVENESGVIKTVETVLSKGVSELDLNGLLAGKYTITATYGGSISYYPCKSSMSHEIRLESTITANALTTTYNINKDLVITLKDAKGHAISGVSVTVNLNGPKVYLTDKNGQVKVTTKDLAAKAYTAKITFNGNANYDKSSKDVKVTVKKATPKMTAKAKTFKKSVKTKKYSITLKNNINKAMKNAKVTIKVNKKTYSAKTNAKGVATFKITKLTKKGKYTATITYKGDSCYNKLTKKVKITIK